jgi:hypothetical protein
MLPYGFCRQLVKRDRAVPFREWAKRSTRVLPRFKIPDTSKYIDATALAMSDDELVVAGMELRLGSTTSTARCGERTIVKRTLLSCTQSRVRKRNRNRWLVLSFDQLFVSLLVMQFPEEQLKMALAAYQQLVSDHPSPAPDYFHKNLGIVASRLAGHPSGTMVSCIQCIQCR